MSTHYKCDRCGVAMDSERGGLELPMPLSELKAREEQKRFDLARREAEGIEVTDFTVERGTRWYDLCKKCRESLRDWVSRDD